MITSMTLCVVTRATRPIDNDTLQFRVGSLVIQLESTHNPESHFWVRCLTSRGLMKMWAFDLKELT